MEPLDGKIALVTGAGVRLGNAIAGGLASAGCDIVLHYRSSVRQAKQLADDLRRGGRRCVVLRADLSKSTEARRLARQAEKAFGRVDILVNNAAVFWPTPPEKLNEKEFDAFIATNLRAPFLLTSELGRRMQKRGWGAIVNIACISAFRPWKTHLPYSISKAGLVALTTGSARLLAPQVRVNAVAPGSILLPAGARPEYARQLAAAAPLKRMGNPRDIVDAVVFLCRASFVTGQVLCVDGGRSIV